MESQLASLGYKVDGAIASVGAERLDYIDLAFCDQRYLVDRIKGDVEECHKKRAVRHICRLKIHLRIVGIIDGQVSRFGQKTYKLKLSRFVKEGECLGVVETRLGSARKDHGSATELVFKARYAGEKGDPRQGSRAVGSPWE